MQSDSEGFIVKQDETSILNREKKIWYNLLMVFLSLQRKIKIVIREQMASDAFSTTHTVPFHLMFIIDTRSDIRVH